MGAFLWCTITGSYGQVVKGKVLDQSNSEAIPYANIGIPGSRVGTITNDDGSFAIFIPKAHSKDTLLFLALGYEPVKIVIRSLRADSALTISLTQKIIKLDSVTVTAKRRGRQLYWLGNNLNQGGNIYSDSISAGAAMALLIENNRSENPFPVFVEKAILKISSNTMAEFKVRIRLLELDRNTRLPGKDLFNENFVVTSHIKKGWLTFDLSSFDIKIEKSFFLAFEWILEEEDRLALLDQYDQFKNVHPEKVSSYTMVVRGTKVPYYHWYNFYAGTSFGVSSIESTSNNQRSYYRNNSCGEWNLASTILTARILVSNQPHKREEKTTAGYVLK